MQFTEKKRRKVFINITSLIDVLFLLLIFLMISSAFIEQPGMKLELPESKTASGEEIKELIIEVNQDGSIFLNGSAILLDSVEYKLKNILPSIENRALVLKADKETRHGLVVSLMDKAKISGIERIIIATKTMSK